MVMLRGAAYLDMHRQKIPNISLLQADQQDQYIK